MLATARLEHFAVVTFDADPTVLAALLPPGVVVDLPLVSAVAYRYVGLGLDGIPHPRLSGDQVHLRAYVRVGETRGVWFLRTVQDSAFATLPRRVWGMPWERGTVAIDEDAAGQVRVAAEGIDLAVVACPEGAPPPAPEVASATVGWFLGRRGVRRFSVAFADDAVVPGRAGCAGVATFEALGLVTAGQRPQSAFRHPDTDITIHLPPAPI
ncbi:MAG: DUF2071 domain-containing protein [Acidimicrobiales bacterium]|nr:DUF2071 domain-containing protein [Acidimicrobiales bacterium]